MSDLTEDLARLSAAARPGRWAAYETGQADNFIVREEEGLFYGPGPIMGPSYDKTTVEYVVALVNAHRAGLLAALPETHPTDDREALAEHARVAVDRIGGWKHLRKFSGMSTDWMDVLRDAIICRVLDTCRPSPPTEEQVECPHWESGNTTLRTSCTACEAEAAARVGGEE